MTECGHVPKQKAAASGTRITVGGDWRSGVIGVERAVGRYRGGEGGRPVSGWRVEEAGAAGLTARGDGGGRTAWRRDSGRSDGRYIELDAPEDGEWGRVGEGCFVGVGREGFRVETERG